MAQWKSVTSMEKTSIFKEYGLWAHHLNKNIKYPPEANPGWAQSEAKNQYLGGRGEWISLKSNILL